MTPTCEPKPFWTSPCANGKCDRLGTYECVIEARNGKPHSRPLCEEHARVWCEAKGIEFPKEAN